MSEQLEVHKNREETAETPGHQAEEIMAEFLGEAFPELIVNIERTKALDKNDRDGMDLICEVRGGHSLAIDVTFQADKKLADKMKRITQNPLAFFHNEAGYPVGEELPRVLLKERNMNLWFLYKNDANKMGVKLTNAMPAKAKQEQKKRFLETVIQQAISLSGTSKDYAQKAKPIVEIFEKELEEMMAHA